MTRILSFLLSLAVLGQARTFTSSDGKTLQAEVVAASETTVTLVRDSDQRRFELPLARLSKSDVAYVETWRTHLEHPLGWRRLRIHGNGQTIAASCLPIYGPIEGDRAWRTESNATLELTLPVGAWVHVGIHPQGARVEGLVEYRGATDWFLSSRGNTLAIQKSPNARSRTRVVQITSENPERSIAQAQGSALRSGASLTAHRPGGTAPPLPRIKYQAASLDLAEPLAWSHLPPSLQALQLRCKGPLDLTGLARFPNLEHLSVSASSLTGLKDLSSLTKLQSIYLKAEFFDSAELAQLGVLKELRHLYLHASERSSPGNLAYSFLGTQTQLESLALINGTRSVATIDADLVKNCKRLTRIDFAPRGAGRDDLLSNLPGLTDLSLAQVDSGITLDLMQSGHFRHLHTIRQANFRDPLINVPNLRNLQIGANAWPRDLPRWDNLPFLERVTLRCPSREALIRICSHRAFQSVHHLVLETNGFGIAPLVQLPKLRSLQLDSHSGTGSFDLAAFPTLRTLELLRSRYLDIPNLGNLQALRLEGPNIDRLGNGSRTELRCLEVIGSKLVNLDGIKDSPNLRSLHLQGCDRLDSTSNLADRGSFMHVHISQCPLLATAAAK